ncbi:MAG: glycosyltransferase [Anaerolineae bacterium]|nr:glycosyltransferase [Anaerolineae bacterium]
MRIAIIALGSRGDVQPYVALGKGLQEAGHDVRLLTHQNYEKLVTAHGLAFWVMRGDAQEVAQSPEMRELLEKGNFLTISAYTAKAAKKAAVEWAEDGLIACDGVDLIIAGIGGVFLGISLAEKLKCPLLQAYYVPFTPTKAFPGALLPGSVPEMGGSFNRLTHHITRQVMWQASRSADQLIRKEKLDLPKAPFWGPYHSACVQGQPILYGYSPSVIPKPADWDTDMHVTGYWFLDSEDNWTPPADLVDFLNAGPPPVYIGFGSMSSRKPEETSKLIVEAVLQSKQRAILLSGWSGIQKSTLPESIFMIDSIPHAWLFPQVAAVIHHGGAGTTAAGLRVGVPSILIPFFADQPFWGQRVAQLGVGPKPIPRKKLSAEKLANAIHIAVTDSAMRDRAAQLGMRIRAENGVAQAVELIQQLETRV